MEGGSYTVGFPDISKIRGELRALQQNKIDKDEKIIRSVVKKLPERGISIADLQRQASHTTHVDKKPPSPQTQQTLENKQKLRQHWKRGPETPKLTIRIIKCIEPAAQPQTQNERTVMILGKVGSGKRTLGNCLSRDDEDLFDLKHGISNSMTRDVSAFYSEFKEEDWVYRILTIDTESLQTAYSMPTSSIRGFEMINSVNLIIFVIPYDLYTDEGLGSLAHAQTSFSSEVANLSALVITRCERLERSYIIKEFRSNKSNSSFEKFMKKGIHPLGFPDTTVSSSPLKELLEEEIAKDAEQIKELVEKCSDQIPVNAIIRGVKQDYSRLPSSTEKKGRM